MKNEMVLTEENVLEQVELNDLLELLPQNTYLGHVDRNDSFDNSLGILQNCIHNNSFDELNETVDDWYTEQIDSHADEYIKVLKNDFENKYPQLSTDIIDDNESDIIDEIYRRDKNNLFDDLFRNTSKQTMFYDTGYEVANGSWNWSNKEIIAERKRIIKKLKIVNISESEFAKIDLMISQASYGGQLVIYFYDNVEDYIGNEKRNTIMFKNPCIAIINTGNGSGDHCELNNCESKLTFNRENIFICKTIKYSYTFAVCGMVSNWCEQTKVSLINNKNVKISLTKTKTALILENDKKYDETFKNGKCTFGDTDFNRHRNVSYINDYPCGHKCPHCGTFWID
jgi:hypothetical protein